MFHKQIMFCNKFALEKHGCSEWVLLAQYRYEEILKKSTLKQLVRF